MAFAIAFDIDTTECTNIGMTDSQRTQLYSQVREALQSSGFAYVQHSVYRTAADDLSSVVAAIDALRKVPNFSQVVREIHAFEIQAWSNLRSLL